jgi:hypothetical protein
MSKLAMTMMTVIVAALIVASCDKQKHGLFADKTVAAHLM